MIGFWEVGNGFVMLYMIFVDVLLIRPLVGLVYVASDTKLAVVVIPLNLAD